MNIMDSCRLFLDRLSHWFLLSIVQLSMEIPVSNAGAITFSPLKSKPVKSCKHQCDKLYKSNFALKMIRIAIFKLATEITFRRFPLPTLWKLGNEIQSNSSYYFTECYPFNIQPVTRLESFYLFFPCNSWFYKL